MLTSRRHRLGARFTGVIEVNLGNFEGNQPCFLSDIGLERTAQTADSQTKVEAYVEHERWLVLTGNRNAL